MAADDALYEIGAKHGAGDVCVSEYGSQVGSHDREAVSRQGEKGRRRDRARPDGLFWDDSRHERVLGPRAREPAGDG